MSSRLRQNQMRPVPARQRSARRRSSCKACHGTGTYGTLKGGVRVPCDCVPDEVMDRIQVEANMRAALGVAP